MNSHFWNIFTRVLCLVSSSCHIERRCHCTCTKKRKYISEYYFFEFSFPAVSNSLTFFKFKNVVFKTVGMASLREDFRCLVAEFYVVVMYSRCGTCAFSLALFTRVGESDIYIRVFSPPSMVWFDCWICVTFGCHRFVKTWFNESLFFFCNFLSKGLSQVILDQTNQNVEMQFFKSSWDIFEQNMDVGRHKCKIIHSGLVNSH